MGLRLAVLREFGLNGSSKDVVDWKKYLDILELLIGGKTAVSMLFYSTGDLQIFEDKGEDNAEHNGEETTDKDLPQGTSSLFECRKSLRARK